MSRQIRLVTKSAAADGNRPDDSTSGPRHRVGGLGIVGCRGSAVPGVGARGGPRDVPEIMPALSRRGLFALIGPADRMALLDRGRTLRAPRGAMLMYEGEPGDRVMVLLAGRVKMTRASQGGRETLLRICDPGDLLGDVAFVEGGTQTATATALEQVEVVVIQSTSFRAHIESTPSLALAMVELLANRFREATLWQAQMCGCDTLGRLAACLSDLTERYGERDDRGIEIDMPLTQEELTAYAGASRAGGAKALQTLRELGWIETRRRRIVVRHPESLKARAGQTLGATVASTTQAEAGNRPHLDALADQRMR
jgi:CRP/FNR family transcriptional regulator, cyclic AMP receptor protein